MANILQVSNIPVQSNIPRQTGVSTEGIQSRQTIDGTDAAVRNTGEQQTGSPEALFGSNYAAFLSLMQESMELPDELAQILTFAGKENLSPDGAELASLLQELKGAITQDSPEKLASFLQQQTAAQARFQGPLFDAVRTVLGEHPRGPFSGDALQFLKCYNDYSSGGHLLRQMQTIGEDLSRMVSRPVQGELNAILEQIDWNAGLGETGKNTEIINSRLIPFLAEYISRTHDYGPTRTAAVLFSLYAVRYENGDTERLRRAYAQIKENAAFQTKLGEDSDQALQKAIASARDKQDRAGDLPELFGKLLQKGTEKENGTGAPNPYSDVMKSMLANESVYLPLLHAVIPFRFQNTDAVTEMWVDPNAGNGNAEDEGSARLFLKFRIQGLGEFEMVTRWKKQDVEMQLFMPPAVAARPETVAGEVTRIVERNGLHLSGLSVAAKQRSLTLSEVFPAMREKGKGVNVRV